MTVKNHYTCQNLLLFMRFKLLPMALILGALGLTGCNYHVESELFPEGCEEIANPTYTEHIEAIITRTCATPECHVPGGEGAGEFTSFQNLHPTLEDGSFEEQVLQDRNMPPNIPLTDCELELINKWIQQGGVQ